MSRGPRTRWSDGPTSRRRQEVLWAIAHAQGLSTAERCVLFVIEAHVSFAERNTGRCWPAIVAIALGVGMDARSVRRLLAALEKKGWLAVEHARGRGNTSTYRVTPPTPPPPTEPEPSPDQGPESGEPDPQLSLFGKPGETFYA